MSALLALAFSQFVRGAKRDALPGVSAAVVPQFGQGCDIVFRWPQVQLWGRELCHGQDFRDFPRQSGEASEGDP